MLRTAPDIPGLPHKWAKEIAAWAFGQLVQWRYVSPEATDADWRDCPYASRGMPNWHAGDMEFRAPEMRHFVDLHPVPPYEPPGPLQWDSTEDTPA